MRHLAGLGVLAAVLALVLAPTSSAGGWATVGFAPLPDGTPAGSTWRPTIYVKQHGVTPLAGLQPIVEAYDDTGATAKFLATETPEAGVYEADVTFPAQGNWSVMIHSGFGESHVIYGPVPIGAPVVGGGDSRETPVVGLGLTVLAALGGLSVLLARRWRRLSPAS